LEKPMLSGILPVMVFLTLMVDRLVNAFLFMALLLVIDIVDFLDEELEAVDDIVAVILF
jgi:hypothetical protein